MEVNQLIDILNKAGLIILGDDEITPARVNPILENITINVTRRCNLRCLHCFVPEIDQIIESLSIQDVKRFIEEGGNFISPNLNFAVLGGEPLLAKERTLQVGQLGKTLNAEVVVSTNGLLIDTAFAEKAQELVDKMNEFKELLKS